MKTIFKLKIFNQKIVIEKLFFLSIFLIISQFLTANKIKAQNLAEPTTEATTESTTVNEQQIALETKNLEGTVVEITATGRESFQDELVPFQELKIELTKGESAGETLKIKNSAASLGLVDVRYQEYEVGDKLKITSQNTGDGDTHYIIEGQIKRYALLKLTLLFVTIVILVGRKWGAFSLLGLVISFLVIFKLIIPLIIQGLEPLWAASLGSLIIIPATFYISHGFARKTHVAVIVTLISLVITGLLAAHFVKTTHLTGFASEEAGFLQVQRKGTIDIRGLLLAGIIIGTLGILDDVTLGQASTIEQLAKANPKMNFKELFIQGMQVGQDHISSMVNTLVLVYSGSALPLLLLFFDSQKSFISILEFELIAEEIVRMLVGSIGLVLAAPLATALAAWLYQNQELAK